MYLTDKTGERKAGRTGGKKRAAEKLISSTPKNRLFFWEVGIIKEIWQNWDLKIFSHETWTRPSDVGRNGEGSEAAFCAPVTGHFAGFFCLRIFILERKHEFWTYMHVLRSCYLHRVGGLWEHRGRPHHRRHLHHRRRLSPHHSPLKLSLVFKILRWSEKNTGGNMCLLFGSNKCRPASNFWEGPNKFRPGLFFRECLNDIQPFACKNKIAFGWLEPRNCVSRSLGFISLQFPALISHRLPYTCCP